MRDVLIPGRGRPYLDGDSLDHSAPLAWTVANMLSPSDCAALVARIDELGPEEAPISTPAGFVMRPDVRNNKRVMFDDHAMAAELFGRVREVVPAQLCGMTPVGINERFRCYRYEPGQRFAPHYDGAYVRNDQERSLLTFIVYLNEGFGGGTTAFCDYECEAIPRTGSALLFQHLLLHEGCTVTSGIKYALRSDVMYRV